MCMSFNGLSRFAAGLAGWCLVPRRNITAGLWENSYLLELVTVYGYIGRALPAKEGTAWATRSANRMLAPPILSALD